MFGPVVTSGLRATPGFGEAVISVMALHRRSSTSQKRLLADGTRLPMTFVVHMLLDDVVSEDAEDEDLQTYLAFADISAWLGRETETLTGVTGLNMVFRRVEGLSARTHFDLTNAQKWTAVYKSLRGCIVCVLESLRWI